MVKLFQSQQLCNSISYDNFAILECLALCPLLTQFAID